MFSRNLCKTNLCLDPSILDMKICTEQRTVQKQVIWVFWKSLFPISSNCKQSQEQRQKILYAKRRDLYILKILWSPESLVSTTFLRTISEWVQFSEKFIEFEGIFQPLIEGNKKWCKIAMKRCRCCLNYCKNRENYDNVVQIWCVLGCFFQFTIMHQEKQECF